jgi:hypothetical protein
MYAASSRRARRWMPASAARARAKRGDAGGTPARRDSAPSTSPEATDRSHSASVTRTWVAGKSCGVQTRACVPRVSAVALALLQLPSLPAPCADPHLLARAGK